MVRNVQGEAVVAFVDSIIQLAKIGLESYARDSFVQDSLVQERTLIVL